MDTKSLAIGAAAGAGIVYFLTKENTPVNPNTSLSTFNRTGTVSTGVNSLLGKTRSCWCWVTINGQTMWRHVPCYMCEGTYRKSGQNLSGGQLGKTRSCWCWTTINGQTMWRHVPCYMCDGAYNPFPRGNMNLLGAASSDVNLSPSSCNCGNAPQTFFEEYKLPIGIGIGLLAFKLLGR